MAAPGRRDGQGALSLLQNFFHLTQPVDTQTKASCPQVSALMTPDNLVTLPFKLRSSEHQLRGQLSAKLLQSHPALCDPMD